MQISVTGRHVEITEAMRSYVESKMPRLLHYYDRIESIDVVVEMESGKSCIEMVIRADHKNTFVAQVAADAFNEAVDLVLDKVERQITKHKEKVRNRKHVKGSAGTIEGEASE